VHAAVAAAWTGRLPRTPDTAWPWVLAVLTGVVITGLANLMWNRSIMLLGMARAGLWLYWMPIFGIALSVIFLGEPVSVWHFVGLTLVLAGTWLGTQRRLS
jgi:drug/metabolite transporter (DMT)-like permease